MSLNPLDFDAGHLAWMNPEEISSKVLSEHEMALATSKHQVKTL